MNAVDELEAELRSAFDAETLSVYADLLQSDGDPRGEIITADLELAVVHDQALKARRDELVTTCFGELHDIATCRFGFLDVRITRGNQLAALGALLAGAPRSYIRWLRLGVDGADLSKALRLVAQHRPDLLVELEVAPPNGASPIERSLCAEVAAAAPQLDVLVVRGKDVLASFAHPDLRALWVTGYAAITNPGPFPAVESLHIELESPPASRSALPPADVMASAWRARQFPALRRLDLSANRDSRVSAYRFLTLTELRSTLHEVRLPRAQGDADRDDVALVARELPRLRIVRPE